MIGDQVNLSFFLCQAYITGDIEIIIVVSDLFEADAAAEAFLLQTVSIGIDDFLDMFIRKRVLFLVLVILLCGIDKEDVIAFAAFLQHYDADRDTCGIEKVGWQPNDAVDIVVMDELLTYAGFGTTAKQHAMRQNNGHRAVVTQIMEPMQKEGEICGTLRRHTLVLEAWVVGGLVIGFPFQTKGWIGHNSIEGYRLHRVALIQQRPFVGERVAVENLKLRVM